MSHYKHAIFLILVVVVGGERGAIFGDGLGDRSTLTVPRAFIVSPAEILERHLCFIEIHVSNGVYGGNSSIEDVDSPNAVLVGPTVHRSILRNPGNTITGLPLDASIVLWVKCCSRIGDGNEFEFGGMCEGVKVSPEKAAFATDRTVEGDCETSPFIGTFFLSQASNTSDCTDTTPPASPSRYSRRRFAACITLSIVFVGSVLCLILLRTSGYLRSKLDFPYPALALTTERRTISPT